MVEQRAPERLLDRARPERVLAEVDRDSEMPGRKGGHERRTTEAPRLVDITTQAATIAKASEIGASVARLMQETSRGLHAAMMLPAAPPGFGKMQEAFATLVTSMMRNNIRLAREILRIYGPEENAPLVRKLMRHWMDTAVESQAAMLRMVQPATGQSPGTAGAPRGPTH
jgi:hypothetical protein